MIYVDPMMLTSPTKNWPYSQSCHMVTDGPIEELHAFAGRLRLKREWFQDHHKNRRYWHYDLTEGKRAQAVRMGAKEITHQQLVQFLQGQPLVIEETQGPGEIEQVKAGGRKAVIKNPPVKVEQVSLWDAAQAGQPEPAPEQPMLTLASLAVYSLATMKFMGEHDQARRTHLREWGHQHTWCNRWFTMYGKYSGFYKTGIPKGKEAWERFLENSPQFAVYCLFVSVFFPGIPLATYLGEEAQQPSHAVNPDILPGQRQRPSTMPKRVCRNCNIVNWRWDEARGVHCVICGYPEREC